MTKKKISAVLSKKLPITVSNPDKVFWPDEGYTKLDLIEFYKYFPEAIAVCVKDRILTSERCPDGAWPANALSKGSAKGFAAGHYNSHSTQRQGQEKVTHYVVGARSQRNSLTKKNIWINRYSRHGRPRAVSAQTGLGVLRFRSANGKIFGCRARRFRLCERILDTLKLVSFCKTSGSRGLHVFVPIKVGPDADDVLNFAETFVKHLAVANPKELTTEHSIAARGNRVYLDPFRNGFGQTVVAPYSVRRKPKAPVSTPLDWSEVKQKLNPSEFNIGNLANRMKRADPWKDFFKNRQSLDKAIKALQKL